MCCLRKMFIALNASRDKSNHVNAKVPMGSQINDTESDSRKNESQLYINYDAHLNPSMNHASVEHPFKLPQLIGDRFRPMRYIASGNFGAVFLAFDQKSNANVVIKVSKKFGKLLYKEYEVYKRLRGSPGICQLLWFNRENDWEDGGSFTYLVLEHGGLALDTLLKKCGGRFSIFTVARLGFEILLRIQTLHEISGFIHRDIKPANFAYNQSANLIYLIDFGLIKEYSKNAEGCECAKGIGTMEYCSVGSGLGFEQSFRDDLEAIGYVLIYFLCGTLPWKDIIAQTREEKVSLITDMKMSTPIDTLCRYVPNTFAEYMNDVKNLKFQERPNYANLQKKFVDLFSQMNIKTKQSYEWERHLQAHSELNK